MEYIAKEPQRAVLHYLSSKLNITSSTYKGSNYSPLQTLGSRKPYYTETYRLLYLHALMKLDYDKTYYDDDVLLKDTILASTTYSSPAPGSAG